MKVIASNQFLKDLKLMKKRGYILKELDNVIDYLKNNISLPIKYKNHILIGNYSKFLECHIKSDWLLIYNFDLQGNVYLFRTGTHSDLFE